MLKPKLAKACGFPNARQTEGQQVTAPCSKWGDSGNLKFCAFNYLCSGLTGLCSESPAFGKLQTVMGKHKKCNYNRPFTILQYLI